MVKPRRGSIQRKLVLLLLLVSLAPMSLLAWSAYRNWQSNLHQQIGASQTSICTQTMDLVDRLLFFCREDLQAWTLTEAMQDVIAGDADGRITAMLMRLKQGYGLYSGIFCVDTSGHVVAASEPNSLGASVADEDWFKQAQTSNDVTITGLQYDPLVYGFAINFTAPIHSQFDIGDKPQVIGYLSSRLNWSELFTITNSVELNENGQDRNAFVVLIDHEGYVLSGPGFMLEDMALGEDRPTRLTELNLIASGLSAASGARKGEAGYLVEQGLEKRPMLIGYAGSAGYQDFRGLGWSVLIMHDVEQAFAPVRHLRNQFLMLMGVTALVGLLLAVIAARHVSVPIRALTRTAVEIGLGDLEQSIEVRSRDEVGELAETINLMTRKLKTSRDELISAKDYTDSVLQSLSNGVLTINFQREVTRANVAAGRLLKTPPEALAAQPLAALFAGSNSWVLDLVTKVETQGETAIAMEADLLLPGATTSVNLAVVPLRGLKDELIGTILVFEDITEEKRIRGTMHRYMTREVADRLLEGGDAMLGGTMQTATMLFSDVRGFTSIAEKLGPQETVSMLNEYLTLMVDIIFDHEGILDKFVGDAIMAVFGVPFQGEQDPDHAVQTALMMRQKLRAHNRERSLKGQDPLDIGVGINTDEVLAGNIGSLRRMDYTVIGDGVNLASRLEGANKFYGTEILISEFTCRALRGNYLIREVDLMRVKGKHEPVAVFEVIDPENVTAPKDFITFSEVYNAALKAYRARRWKDAADGFQEASRLYVTDSVSAVYLARCDQLLKSPPADTWDGVWDLKEK